MNSTGRKKLLVIDLTLQRYRPIWDLQRRLHSLRYREEIPDTLILVEHLPVYTIGKNGKREHITASEEFLKSRGIEIVYVDRGGDVTYHGPGQLVGYPIFNLKQHITSVSRYIHSLEEVFIRTLSQWKIQASRINGLPGAWVGREKITAIGVRISRWVTMHGFAFNLSTDLSFYRGIVPCGIHKYGVTSMEKILGYPPDADEVKSTVINSFRDVFYFMDIEFQTLNGETPEDKSVLEKIAEIE